MEATDFKTGQNRIVLIGSSGAGNAFSSVLALRRTWGNLVKIITIDINPACLVTSSLISDKFYQVNLSILRIYVFYVYMVLLYDKVLQVLLLHCS